MPVKPKSVAENGMSGDGSGSGSVADVRPAPGEGSSLAAAEIDPLDDPNSTRSLIENIDPLVDKKEMKLRRKS